MRLQELRYTQFNRAPASIIPRLMAVILDSIILSCLLFFSGLMTYFLVSRYGFNQEYFYGIFGLLRFNLVFWGPLTLFIIYVYYAMFTACYGASPGKMFMGLRVVDFYSGENLGLIQVLLREFFGKSLSLIFFFGYILSLLRTDGRALHDFFASSQVIAD